MRILLDHNDNEVLVDDGEIYDWWVACALAGLMAGLRAMLRQQRQGG